MSGKSITSVYLDSQLMSDAQAACKGSSLSFSQYIEYLIRIGPTPEEIQRARQPDPPFKRQPSAFDVGGEGHSG